MFTYEYFPLREYWFAEFTRAQHDSQTAVEDALRSFDNHKAGIYDYGECLDCQGTNEPCLVGLVLLTKLKDEMIKAGVWEKYQRDETTPST